MLGVIPGGWFLEVPGVTAERRRDTRGPSAADIRAMLDATAGDTEVETRTAAIVTLFFCLGLRVSELCAVTLAETDLSRATMWIKGKGRREKELVPLPAAVVTALRRYLPWRGPAAGPLLRSRARHRSRDAQGEPTWRLHPGSVLRLIEALGRRVGVKVWCHGLRHAAVTQAIIRGQQGGVGLDQIRTFSRHKSLDTMLLYRDAYEQQAVHRQLVDLVAAALDRPGAPVPPPPEPEPVKLPYTSATW